jgi:uncharacterized protein (UPF0264 family)
MAGLLVSVRSAAEASAALAGGAALVDVKEPARGSLGRAPDAVRAAVLAVVAGRVPVSVALGELADGLDPGPGLAGVAFAKWGLAGCRERGWQGLLRQARDAVEETGCRLVVSAYADWRRADSPVPREVCHFAAVERAAVLLVDTWHKDGSTLLDWLSSAEVAELVQTCRGRGVRVALAGSLGARQIAGLAHVRPDWFAVRGAVCAQRRREAAIDPERVRDLAEVVRREQ